MKIQVIQNILDISEASWNQLAPTDFPFARYEFLKALHANACLGPRTGWSPLLLTAWEESPLQHRLRGVFILFQKTNSYGEYIFDFAWAQAHESHGLEYYPKLVSAIPFTPATGPKLLLDPQATPEEQSHLRQSLLTAATTLIGKIHASSLHALFVMPAEFADYQQAGLFIRHSYQYHWRNADYKTFDDFLGSLRSKRRREILRERAQVTTSGVKIHRLTGEDLKPHHAEQMHEFYLSTVQKMGGYNYLTRDFFHEVFNTMKDAIVFVLATDSNGRPVAGAMNYFGANTLFGRHWGCLEDYKALHFEVCYYQGIEFAIERGLSLFEAGAQGEHKFQRGFLPTLTYSAHRIQERRLEAAIQDFVEREKEDLKILFEDYDLHSPFQRTPTIS